MKIYGVILSPYVCRVVLAARYKGLDFEMTMPEGGLKTPEFLKLNPLGKMPTLKDRSIVLPESSAILEYLDVKYPKKKLVPGAAKSGAMARLIGTLADLYVQAPVLALLRQRDPQKRDKKVVEEKLAEVDKGLDVLDMYLKPEPYAAGKKFSIADCYAVPALFFLTGILPDFGVKDPIGKRKNVKKYWSNLKKDPLSKQAIKEMDVMLKAFKNR